VHALRRAGVRVSVNTDDPTLLGTTLPREYAIARTSYGWTDDVVRDVARTSIEASFAASDIMQKLWSDLCLWPR
jgi:adenosine deaminase